MQRSANACPGHIEIEIHSQSERFGETDACLEWLKLKYATPSAVQGRLTQQFREAFENDVRACSSLRWDRFAFPMHPYLPLRTNFINESSNRKLNTSTAVVFDHVKRTGQNEGNSRNEQGASDSPRKQLKITLIDSGMVQPLGNGAPISAKDELETEWSRHIFAEVVRKRTAEPHEVSPSLFPALAAASSNETSLYRGGGDGNDEDQRACARPFFGGYFTAPTLADQIRFLVFPQGGSHTLSTGAAPPALAREARARKGREVARETPYYLRGSLELLHDRDRRRRFAQKGGTIANNATSEPSFFGVLRDTVRANLTFARKFPVGPSWQLGGWRGLLAALGRPPVLEVEPHANGLLLARRPFGDAGKVQRQSFLSDGVCVRWHQRNPRQAVVLETARLRCDGEDVFRVQGDARYDSATQRWGERVVYNLKGSVGPGMEYSTGDKVLSLFGKLSSEAWAAWMLPRGVMLELRGLSGVVVPYSSRHRASVVDTREANDKSNWVLNEQKPSENQWAPFPSDTAEHRLTVNPHQHFWATQAPKLDLSLLRGFSYDYANLRDVQRWYALFAVEITRRLRFARQKSEGSHEEGDRVQPPAVGMDLKVFANTCFVDSFQTYPRASVGVSFVSLAPRSTVDAFNKILPRTFECSFNWLVAFREGQLRSGLESRQSRNSSFLRVSPVEKFQHMRCGLTWEM